MSIAVLLEAGVISAIVAFIVSFFTVKFLAIKGRRRLPVNKLAKPERKYEEPRRQKPINKKVKEKEKSRKMEYETSPDHSAVLRKIASDMRSQLKGFSDSISRVPVPVVVPEISTMALWSDLIRNHLQENEFDFESGWYRYIELLREHSRLEANLFIDIEALIKEKMVGYAAVNNDNVNIAPPENTVYYNSELIGSIMRNWLDSIRGSDLHYPLDNGTDLGMEDAKKYLKIPDARFLTLYNKKIGSGPEVIVEELETIARELLLNFHDTPSFVKYRSNLTENETEVTTLQTRLKGILSNLEALPVFKGLCEYSH